MVLPAFKSLIAALLAHRLFRLEAVARVASLKRCPADSGGGSRYRSIARPRPGVRRCVTGGAFLAVTRQMTGTRRSSEGLDLRRRKLLFRSWHRGMREMDLI